MGCKNKSPSVEKNQPVVTSKQISSYTPREIDNMLRHIEENKPLFEPLRARCYKVALPNRNPEYICIKDGEKTLYNSPRINTIFTLANIVTFRRLIRQINNSSFANST